MLATLIKTCLVFPLYSYDCLASVYLPRSTYVILSEQMMDTVPCSSLETAG